MEIKTYQEIVAPDERSKLVAFIEARLPDGGFDMEIAARAVQEYVSRIDLHSDVPKVVADSFERVRKVYSYGLFEYEMFTVAQDQVILLLEQALRERFMALYDNEVTLVHHQSKEEERLKVTDFEVLRSRLNGREPKAKGPWRLKLRSGAYLRESNGQPADFRGGLAQLQKWARQEGLLHGQRTRTLDPYFVEDRNMVAHPSYRLVGPGEATRTIYDMAETINRLWGHLTPGGNLYPAPIQRTAMIVAWKDEGRSLAMMRAEQLPYFMQPGDWTLIIVLGAEGDTTLMGFDSRYERTAFPSELLWGPGSKAEAEAWSAEHGVVSDECAVIDRRFAVQVVGGKTYLPRRPEVALGLPPERRAGTWHLLIADNYLDAFNKVRSDATAVEEIFVGDWDKMAERLRRDGVSPVQAPPVCVPGFRSRVAPDVGAD